MKHPAIRDIHFYNPQLSRIGIEVLALSDLYQRLPKGLCSPERVGFYIVLLVERGRGKHMVDFVEHSLKPGTLMFVRPGQVQQWRLSKSLQGQLVLVSNLALLPSFNPNVVELPLLKLDEWPATRVLGRDLWQAALMDTERLSGDINQFEGNDIEVAIVQQSFKTLLLRLSREVNSSLTNEGHSRELTLYRLLVRELETAFHKRRSVLYYANRLGYSESTLSTACAKISGVSAKQVIDRRLALEAKRLLVHSQATTVEISHQLGFTEPTNFVKFFKRLEGETPQAFRKTVLSK